MSVYTTELRYICEELAGYDPEQGYMNVKDVIERSRTKLFDFEYPIFSELHKAELETKIIRHYYTREIGAETPFLFKLWLEERMNEIMPRFNKMFEAEAEEIKLYHSIDFKKDGDRVTADVEETESETSAEGESNTDKENETTIDYGAKTTTSRSNSGTRTDNLTENTTIDETVNQTTTDDRTEKTKDKFSDTPQGGLTGVENDTYLTNARITEKSFGAGSMDVNTTRSGSPVKTNTGTVSNVGSENGTTENSGEDVTTGIEGITTTTKDDSSTKAKTNKDGTEVTKEHTYGMWGHKTYGEVLATLKDVLFDIDMLIIESLEDLFMGVF